MNHTDVSVRSFDDLGFLHIRTSSILVPPWYTFERTRIETQAWQPQEYKPEYPVELDISQTSMVPYQAPIGRSMSWRSPHHQSDRWKDDHLARVQCHLLAEWEDRTARKMDRLRHLDIPWGTELSRCLPEVVPKRQSQIQRSRPSDKGSSEPKLDICRSQGRQLYSRFSLVVLDRNKTLLCSVWLKILHVETSLTLTNWWPILWHKATISSSSWDSILFITRESPSCCSAAWHFSGAIAALIMYVVAIRALRINEKHHIDIGQNDARITWLAQIGLSDFVTPTSRDRLNVNYSLDSRATRQYHPAQRRSIIAIVEFDAFSRCFVNCVASIYTFLDTFSSTFPVTNLTTMSPLWLRSWGFLREHCQCSLFVLFPPNIQYP